MKKSTQDDMQTAIPWIKLSKIIAVSILCLLLSVTVQGEEGENRTAVLPFEIYTAEPMDHLRHGFQEILSLRLSSKGFPVVSTAVVNQHPKASLSVLEEKDLYAIGHDLGADWVVTGTITEIVDKVSLNLKILDVTGGKRPVSLSIVEDDINQLGDVAERVSDAIYNQIKDIETIESIQVKGNKRIETEAILTVIETQPGDGYDAERLNRDLKAIYKMGYFSEDLSIESQDTPTGRIVTFVVNEMPSIAKIRFKGAKKGKEKDLMEEAGIKLYTIVDQNEIRQSINRLKEYYRKKGYYNAEITERIEELENNEISLTYEIDRGEKVYITEIKFVGNKEFDDGDLKDVMHTSEKGWFSWINDSGKVDDTALEYDVHNIGVFYRNNGFMKANVGHPEIAVIKEGELSLTIEIIEGSRYRVKEVKVGGDLVKTEEELLTFTNIGKEKFYNAEVIYEDIQALKNVCADYGYAYAEVSPLISEDDENHLVDIVYHIDKAEKVRFERINILGNVKTRDKVIRRELEVVEGGLYNGTAINESTEKLNRLGFFDNVEMGTRKGSEDDLIILDVNVEESYRTGSYGFGIAWSDYEGFVGHANVTVENLMGRGQQLSTSVYYGDVSKNIMIQFSEPWVYDRDISGSIMAFLTEYEYYEYTTESIGGALGLGFPLESWGLGDLTRGSVRLSHENSDIQDVASSAAMVIREMEGKNIANSITLGISRISWDRPWLPTKGSYNSFTVETTGGILGGDVGYNKYMLRTEWYFPLFWSTVFVAKGNVGLIKRKGQEKLPVFKKFILGGVGSVRGFDDYSISPRDPVSGDRIRGEKMMFYNFEYRFPLGKKKQGITGLVFFDAGNVWTTEEDYDFTGMRMAAGVGGMWWTPMMGQMSIYYGRKLDP
ncbi:MAG: outer membrane protein assembly factor BamA, partial [Deltaproteobacteria bacterium]|nr:outer membrane protein assembly factor BamA [Deltaproteobacteria bacterium]